MQILNCSKNKLEPITTISWLYFLCVHCRLLLLLSIFNTSTIRYKDQIRVHSKLAPHYCIKFTVFVVHGIFLTYDLLLNHLSYLATIESYLITHYYCYCQTKYFKVFNDLSSGGGPHTFAVLHSVFHVRFPHQSGNYVYLANIQLIMFWPNKLVHFYLARSTSIVGATQ